MRHARDCHRGVGHDRGHRVVAGMFRRRTAMMHVMVAGVRVVFRRRDTRRTGRLARVERDRRQRHGQRCNERDEPPEEHCCRV